MEIILKPIVTEKMTQLGETLNRFGFKVDRRANKIEIKKAVEQMYNVTVTDVSLYKRWHCGRKNSYLQESYCYFERR